MADRSGASRLIRFIRDQAQGSTDVRLSEVEDDGVVRYGGVALDPEDYINITKSPMKKGDTVAIYKEIGAPEDDDQYIVIGESTTGQEAPALGSITNSWLEDNLQED